MDIEPRVLSIQSHVVRGYVGNKSATFPLQVLGFEVDAINSVQLSNHTGYTYFMGQVLDEKDLEDLVTGLDRNELTNYTHILTGYVGCPSFLKRIADIVKKFRKDNQIFTYVCDPVLGDNGKLYVPETLVPIYRDVIVPLADIVTPNQFEAELLTGIEIKKIDDAWKAIDEFHNKGVKNVIISSSELGEHNSLLTLASSVADVSQRKRYTVSIPQLDASFTGSGDLFAALILAWMYKTNGDLVLSLENTVATMQAVLKRTLHHALVLTKGARPSVGDLELQLIQSKEDIENPQPQLRCTTI